MGLSRQDPLSQSLASMHSREVQMRARKLGEEIMMRGFASSQVSDARICEKLRGPFSRQDHSSQGMRV